MRRLLALAIAVFFIARIADSQTSTTTTTTNQGTTTTQSTTGMITQFTPGASIVLRTTGEGSTRYELSKDVTYVTSDGKAVDPSKLKQDTKVRVHYVPGGRTMVDKVIVED